ncbi:molybdopterin oxidoreductase family protein [Polynucleobacter sp.]|jgi:anaerobic selenocysteine-containing dehydrogenase|uniref:molybdopterin oxidoreductase family protein n=1 Tax=Polynucleobacter sp. TaxID=2029855 RepID=UPI002733946C|nr:molybdopterin oxidoreductase family protein [Polynucleobacter sp.]MDP3122194.1 molybdopterin oxidoreductase family protein [Polynucleobacter sp.]
MFKIFSKDPIHDPIHKQAAATEIKKTTCYMCACRCGIRAHLRDGELVYIDGNPEHPLNQGVICAKGSAGIMKQKSPARITKPLLRKKGSDRGAGEFDEISWEQAFELLTDRLKKIRETDPKKFALFTGRDQMQALTGLFARQFGTPNYAAHGGFCSVNMAAGMIYTIGGSFWEFGGPDLDHAKLFIMIGTAEDHHSNPMKIALSKFKRAGGRFISINPVRTGYSAIADEWIPIKPGTDGALFMALMHELIRTEQYDADFLKRYSNSGQLVCLDAGPEEGLFLFDPDSDPINADLPHNKYVWDANTQSAKPCFEKGVSPTLCGEFIMGPGPHQGKKVAPAFELLRKQVQDTTPEWASSITGIPADRIKKLATEIGQAAFEQAFEMPVAWTDAWGESHQTVTARPVAFHAMRGLAAHSNGFQTTRGLAVLMSLIGTIDRPGGFRHKAPYPRQVPPNVKPPSSENDIKPNTPLGKAPLGWPTQPEDLALDAKGNALRIDKAYTWEHPLAAHGLMHNVITNAVKGDPYSIDTLMIFMANMSWNSTMNTMEVRELLNSKNADGEFKIPFLVVCDAFQSEMVDFADLVLPDTTYLERHDAMSLLDRPISEYDGPVDSVRIPVLPTTGECKPFQEVLIELASRLKFPAFTTEDGGRKFKDYPDFITRFETAPNSGIGFLAGWRGKDGEKSLRGEPNPDQWKRYAENNCVFHYKMPVEHQYMRNWNRGYLDFSKANALRQKNDPIMIAIYSDILQKFRLAAKGQRPGSSPPEHLKSRILKYFDPLPFWYPPLEDEVTDLEKYSLNAITQRPMAMYHSWDSQNAWLRQIHSHNYLYVNTKTALEHGINDGAWMWIESQWGKVKCMARHSEAVDPGTVWTWNAIGKAESAWSLDPSSDESKKGFLLNHLISEELSLGGFSVSNSDPITGQAGWYDVRVKLAAADENEPEETWPQVKAHRVPGMITK